MHLFKIIILMLAVLQGAWLVYDGSRALIIGDYLTARSGQQAGKLGPWSRVISAVGLQPRSTFVKTLHVCLGAAWLLGTILYGLNPLAGGWTLMLCALATLWYLPLGTIISILTLTLILLTRRGS